MKNLNLLIQIAQKSVWGRGRSSERPKMKTIATISLTALVLFGCSNKDINEGEEFRLRAVKDSFDNVEFAKVTVDGVEYLMMERDNNNPHEGFGFMAFRANKVIEKQDSIISFLKAMQFYQNKMYARMYNLSEEEAQYQFDATFEEFLSLEMKELQDLDREDLSSTEASTEEE